MNSTSWMCGLQVHAQGPGTISQASSEARSRILREGMGDLQWPSMQHAESYQQLYTQSSGLHYGIFPLGPPILHATRLSHHCITGLSQYLSRPCSLGIMVWNGRRRGKMSVYGHLLSGPEPEGMPNFYYVLLLFWWDLSPLHIRLCQMTTLLQAA